MDRTWWRQARTALAGAGRFGAQRPARAGRVRLVAAGLGVGLVEGAILWLLALAAPPRREPPSAPAVPIPLALAPPEPRAPAPPRRRRRKADPAAAAVAARSPELARGAPGFPLIGDKAKAKDLQAMADYRDQLRQWRESDAMTPHPCPPQKEPVHKLYLDHCALMNGGIRLKYRF